MRRKSDWEIFKAIAKKFSEVAPEILGVETDVVACRSCTTRPARSRRLDVKDWKKGECDLIPGKTAPTISRSSATIRNLYDRFTALGPLMDKLGNGGKGISWNTKDEVEHLSDLNGVHRRGPTKGMAKIETDIDACEVILMLAPETNGEVAVKAWEALEKATGREHAHLAEGEARERSASATSRRNRARSSRRPPGRASRARRSATTPATPTCTS